MGQKGDTDVQLPVAPLPDYDSCFHTDRIKSMGGNDTNTGKE